MKLVIAVLVLIVLALVFLAPAVLILVAAVRYKRTVEDPSGWMILIAGSLLSVLTLCIVEPIVTGLLLREPEEVAAAAMVMAVVQPAITYLAVLLLGIGLWVKSGKLRSASSPAPPLPQLQGQGGE